MEIFGYRKLIAYQKAKEVVLNYFTKSFSYFTTALPRISFTM